MHEAAIAAEVIDQIVRLGAEHGASCVHTVELAIGELELIVPEALETAFSMAAAGTIAAHARLIMHEISPKANCRHCGCHFIPRIACYVCPHCQHADAEITAGKGIILSSLDMDT